MLMVGRSAWKGLVATNWLLSVARFVGSLCHYHFSVAVEYQIDHRECSWRASLHSRRREAHSVEVGNGFHEAQWLWKPSDKGQSVSGSDIE